MMAGAATSQRTAAVPAKAPGAAWLLRRFLHGFVEFDEQNETIANIVSKSSTFGIDACLSRGPLIRKSFCSSPVASRRDVLYQNTFCTRTHFVPGHESIYQQPVPVFPGYSGKILVRFRLPVKTMDAMLPSDTAHTQYFHCNTCSSLLHIFTAATTHISFVY